MAHKADTYPVDSDAASANVEQARAEALDLLRTADAWILSTYHNDRQEATESLYLGHKKG